MSSTQEEKIDSMALPQFIPLEQQARMVEGHYVSGGSMTECSDPNQIDYTPGEYNSESTLEFYEDT